MRDRQVLQRRRRTPARSTLPACVTRNRARVLGAARSDQVTQGGRLTLRGRRDPFEPHRLAPRALEEADAIAEENRGDVDDDLVQEPRLETLPSDVRAKHDHVASVRRLLGDPRRLFDADVQEAACYPLHDRRLGGQVVAEHEERAAEGAAVEARLITVLNVLRSPADEQCSRRAEDLVDRLAGSAVHPGHPSHVAVGARDETVEAHSRVPENLARPDSPFVKRLDSAMGDQPWSPPGSVAAPSRAARRRRSRPPCARSSARSPPACRRSAGGPALQSGSR